MRRAFGLVCPILITLGGCVQKFPDWVVTATTINTCWEAIQSVYGAKLTRLTHKIAIQLHLVAESCTICSSRSRRPVRKLLDAPSYVVCLFLVITFDLCNRVSWNMVIVPLDGTPSLYFVISCHKYYQHNGRTKLWGGSYRSATWCRVMKCVVKDFRKIRNFCLVTFCRITNMAATRN
jgi:hypothetical protein